MEMEMYMDGWMDTCMQVLLRSFVPHPIPSHPIPSLSQNTRNKQKDKKGAHGQVWMDGGMGWMGQEGSRGEILPQRECARYFSFFRDNLNERVRDVRGHVSHPFLSLHSRLQSSAVVG